MKQFFLFLGLLMFSTTVPAQCLEQERKMEIMKICEDLNSAFIAKDITYVEGFFKDKLYLEKKGRTFSQVKEPKELINDIYRIWRDKEYTSRISDMEIKQSLTNSSFYSASFLIEWTGNHYNKNGYLFLVIEFRDNPDPIVHVCVWCTGEPLKKEDIPTIEDFL